jgi:hypothetical protein
MAQAIGLFENRPLAAQRGVIAIGRASRSAGYEDLALRLLAAIALPLDGCVTPWKRE